MTTVFPFIIIFLNMFPLCVLSARQRRPPRGCLERLQPHPGTVTQEQVQRQSDQ